MTDPVEQAPTPFQDQKAVMNPRVNPCFSNSMSYRYSAISLKFRATG